MSERLSLAGMLALGLLCGLAQATGHLPPPPDALNYWNADLGHLYPVSWGDWQSGAWLYYPPIVAQAFALLHPLTWPVFVTLWTTALFAAFWYCARGWSLPLAALGLIPVMGGPNLGLGLFLGYALLGNMQWLLAAAALAAIRRPELWALEGITKIGPGVGAVWHLVRGEWSVVGRIALVAAIPVGLSVALAPGLWVDFIGFAARNASMADAPIPLNPVPFPIRAAMSVALVAWGARTDRPWTMPVAAGWALPALYGLAFLVFWIGPLRTAAAPRGLGSRTSWRPRSALPWAWRGRGTSEGSPGRP